MYPWWLFICGVRLHHTYFRTIRIRRFRYFQCVTFRVMLNRALTSCDMARRARFLILPFIETHRSKEQSEKYRKLNRFLGIKVVIVAKIALQEEFPRVTTMSIKQNNLIIF